LLPISDDDRCVKSKGVVNCLAYPFRDCCRIFCLGLKDDVSTLNVRLDIPKAKTSAQFAKMVHPDYFLSAYIDASQHRDVSRHALLPIELSLIWVLRTSSGFSVGAACSQGGGAVPRPWIISESRRACRRIRSSPAKPSHCLCRTESLCALE